MFQPQLIPRRHAQQERFCRRGCDLKTATRLTEARAQGTGARQGTGDRRTQVRINLRYVSELPSTDISMQQVV